METYNSMLISETAINNINRRNESRVDLQVKLYLRRPNNSSSYRRLVETENVSRQGVRIILDLPLEIGAQLEVSGFNDRFNALAIVKHVEERWDGRWSIGLRFIKKSGKWIIS